VLFAFLNTTPCTTLPRREAKEMLGIDAELVFKLELLQVTGSFNRAAACRRS
jgi:hypothetical protein